MFTTFNYQMRRSRNARKMSAVLLLWAAPIICAQAQDTNTTLGFANGQAWGRMSESMKLGFVVGFADGFGSAVAVSTYDDRFPSKSTNGEIVKALDKFYEEPANAAIPITGALQIFTAQVRGVPSDAIRQMTEAWRQGAATSKDAEKPATVKQ